MQILVAAIGIGCLLGEPGEIIVTSSGLTQKLLFGLKTKTICWKGAAASHPLGLKEVLVIGNDGTTISHSRYHVAQHTFLIELEQHHVYVR